MLFVLGPPNRIALIHTSASFNNARFAWSASNWRSISSHLRLYETADAVEGQAAGGGT